MSQRLAKRELESINGVFRVGESSGESRGDDENRIGLEGGRRSTLKDYIVEKGTYCDNPNSTGFTCQINTTQGAFKDLSVLVSLEFFA
jgi:hypothetical protein